MKRWLFTILSALSLVLCLGTCALWAQSYRGLIGVHWGGWYVAKRLPEYKEAVARERRRSLVTARGELLFEGKSQESMMPAWAADDLIEKDGARSPRFFHSILGAGNQYGPPSRDTFWQRLGFFWNVRRGRVPTTHYYEGAMPLWSIALPLAVLPATWLVARRPRHRKPGVCPACGYDLRATPERCPECGAINS